MHRYAVWGQVFSSVALIAWALVPIFYGNAGGRNLAFFSVVASVYMLAVTLHQQGADYIERAGHLESSARRIDALRKDVQASILDGKDTDASEYRKLSRRYSELLDENPINHEEVDHRLASGKKFFYVLPAGFVLHARAGLTFWLCLALVVVVPIVLLAHEEFLSNLGGYIGSSCKC